VSDRTSVVRIGVLGRITAGEEIGRYVKVEDDRENTGGYLILTADDPQLSFNGYDGWVESRQDLDGYFGESGWVVAWLG